MPSRRRHALWAIAGGLLCAAIALLSLSTVPGAGALTGLDQVRNILGMVSTRSPGERGAAEFLKHQKSARAAPVAEAPPEQRALGKIFDAPGPKSPIDEAVLALAPPAFAAPGGAGTLSTAPSAFAAPAYGGGAPGSFIGGGGGGQPGSIGGGGGTTPISETPNQLIVAPPPAVPEPQTWALMFLGFGLCGAALRRRPTGERTRVCRA